jgi:prolyl-tRNA editing enzyme YbaK/EbsC (Cys-tRNA(Pro) deacylase)
VTTPISGPAHSGPLAAGGSGALDWLSAAEHPDLLAGSVKAALGAAPGLRAAEVAAIDPALADTEAFCERYGVAPSDSANCVVVAARRGGVTTYAACLVLATTRADVNGLVRRHLEARRASFAPLAEVVTATGMEYGGITPVGLPEGWRILLDEAVAQHPAAVIGSGLRSSKLRLPGSALAALPGAEVLPGLGVPRDDLS